MGNTVLSDGLQEFLSCGLTTKHAEYLLRHPWLAEDLLGSIEKVASVQNPDGSFKDEFLARDSATLGLSRTGSRVLKKEGFATIGDFVGATRASLKKTLGNYYTKKIVEALAKDYVEIPDE